MIFLQKDKIVIEDLVSSLEAMQYYHYKSIRLLYQLKFVFQARINFKEQLSEIFRYILSKGLTGIVDFAGLIISWGKYLYLNKSHKE